MIEPPIKRASATAEELAARRTGSGVPRNTTADYEILDERPYRLPNSSIRRNLPAPKREYMIPLTDGTTLFVTEQKLATMGRDYKETAQEVEPGTIAQKQRRQPRPNPNRAEPIPDVMYGKVARQQDIQTQPAAYFPTPGERVNSFAKRALIVLCIGLFIMIVGYVVFSIVGTWWTTQQNDWAYGRPRTFQIDWNVGHGTASNPDSHFIAQNLHRQMVVIEIPGDDPSKAKIYIGPSLIGPGQDLAPVTLSFEDVNHDGKPDLVIHVEDQRFIFFNQQVKGVWQFVPAPNQQ